MGHTMIVTNEGSLWATGYNGSGQLGDGTTENRYLPVEVMRDVAFVSAESVHTMVIRNDGTLWAFGKRRDGRLGDGELVGFARPVRILLP